MRSGWHSDVSCTVNDSADILTHLDFSGRATDKSRNQRREVSPIPINKERSLIEDIFSFPWRAVAFTLKDPSLRRKDFMTAEECASAELMMMQTVRGKGLKNGARLQTESKTKADDHQGAYQDGHRHGRTSADGVSTLLRQFSASWVKHVLLFALRSDSCFIVSVSAATATRETLRDSLRTHERPQRAKHLQVQILQTQKLYRDS